MSASEHLPRLTEAGRNLVKDQECAVAVAGLAHRLPIAGRRQIGDGASGLGDHRGDIALALQNIGDVTGAGHSAQSEVGLAVALGVAIGAAIASKGCDMLGSAQQRPDGTRAEELLASDAGGAEARAME